MLSSIADRYQQLLKRPLKNHKLQSAINIINDSYMKLRLTRESFVNQLDQQIASKDVNKFKHFKEANLNIQLNKFSGYESQIDYYTFKSDFEKLRRGYYLIYL